MPNNRKLKRVLSLPLLTLYGLGTILGAGIYVLIGKVAATSGMYAPIAFMVAALLAAFTGLSYAELSARYPFSAAEAVYVNRAFKIKSLSAIVGWLVLLTGVISSATIANGFVGYLSLFITSADWLPITLLLITLTALACWGITESVIVASIATIIEIAGLIFVLIIAGGELGSLPERLPELLPPMEGAIWLSVLLGAFIAFYAFIGFEDMVNVAEEVIEPKRTLPLAIIFALVLSSILYVLIALVAVLALPLQELQNSRAPMASLLMGYSKSASTTIAIISIFAVINGALVQLIMGSRLLYGMANQGLAPHWLANVSAKTQTPVSATIIVGIVILILALIFPLITLAKITSFIIIAVFFLVNISLVILKYRQPSVTGVFKLNPIVPIAGAAFCILFLMVQLYYLFSG